jgi:hypothetical protein
LQHHAAVFERDQGCPHLIRVMIHQHPKRSNTVTSAALTLLQARSDLLSLPRQRQTQGMTSFGALSTTLERGITKERSFSVRHLTPLGWSQYGTVLDQSD